MIIQIHGINEQIQEIIINVLTIIYFFLVRIFFHDYLVIIWSDLGQLLKRSNNAFLLVPPRNGFRTFQLLF